MLSTYLYTNFLVAVHFGIVSALADDLHVGTVCTPRGAREVPDLVKSRQ